jgi:hypothetical protein
MMGFMSGAEHRNRLNLILNQGGVPRATSPQDQELRRLWPRCQSGRDPVSYNDGTVAGQSSEIVNRILSMRETVLLGLIDEYGNKEGLLHETTAGKALSQQITDELDEIRATIRKIEKAKDKPHEVLDNLRRRAY